MSEKQLLHSMGNIIKKQCNRLNPRITSNYYKHVNDNDNIIRKGILLAKCFVDSTNDIKKHDIDYEKIMKMIDESEVISFDIFDTLLCRVFASPKDVFRYIEHITGLNGFSEKRISAEEKARSIPRQNEDVTLDEIYNLLPAEYQLKDLEIEIEISIQHRNPTIEKIYEYASKKNKKIIIVSDMYLPKNAIETMLDSNGYNYDELYLSNDIGLMKFTGSLFDYIITNENIDPDKILHIGDNAESDCAIPIKKGIKSIYITKNIDWLLDYNCRASVLYKNYNDIETSLILGVMALLRIEKLDYWTEFGAMYGGPAVCSYANWIANNVEKDNINNILFVARDGYSVKKAFEIITNNTIKTHYVYLPRRISNLINMDYKSKMQNNVLEGEASIKSLISIYNKYHTGAEITGDYNCQIKFIDEHKSQFDDLSKLTRNKYTTYMDNIICSEPIALIDLITIHFSSPELIMNLLPETKIHCYYWFVEKKNNANLIEKYKPNHYQEDMWNEVSDWNIMEFLMTSPEYPIDDIDNEGTPIFRTPTENDINRSKAYEKVSEGEILFTKLFVKYASDIDIDISAETINRYMNILCQIPTKKDKNMFSKIKHSYDTENKIFVPLFSQW